MKRRRRVAWTLAAVGTVLLVTGTVVQLVATGGTRPLEEVLVAVVVLAVGTLLTVRRPDNRVGWTYALSAQGFAWLSAFGVVSAIAPRPLAVAFRLRDQVDLSALRGDLSRVVAVTMAPAHVSVWLRSAEVVR